MSERVSVKAAHKHFSGVKALSRMRAVFMGENRVISLQRYVEYCFSGCCQAPQPSLTISLTEVSFPPGNSSTHPRTGYISTYPDFAYMTWVPGIAKADVSPHCQVCAPINHCK